ncbi:MFS transporter [Phreatobacter oligotrophus]|jgi:predicted MFS family arabinose efflux permease|uniref:MFS transporter n=1 Tax=Phreatobacter oligotrophus TaxID=1122261 RepID=UPI0023579F07|nr:MFS transporter [Phreatobacter oligotrophus]MBX9989022.1 MFS transporter [Phreatobacter oligotrophus]
MTTQRPTAFSRLFATAALVQAADQIALAALPVTAVLLLGAGPAMVGLLVAAQTAAWLLVSLPAGVLVDRLPAPRVIRAALVLALVGMVAAIAAAQMASPALLAAAVFIASAGTVTFVLVQVGLVPRLVPAAGLPAANARIELARALATAAAPMLVGVLATRLSPAAAYPLAAVLTIGALVLGMGLRPAAAAPAARPPVLTAIAEGTRFVIRHPLLRAIALCAVFWNFAFIALLAVFVPFALARLSTDAAGAGLAQGFAGLGMIAGALAAPALLAKLQPRVLLVFGPCVSALAALAILAAPSLGGIALAGFAFALIGFGPILWLVMQLTVRQIVTPPELMGRVTATIQVAIYGVRPLGALAGGAMAQGFGLDAALVLVAIAFAASALACLASPLARLAALPAPATAAGGL